MKKDNLIFLDTETTGTGPNDRLCQVAYKYGGKEYDSLFKPPVPIEVAAMAVSHITNRMVADKEPFAGSEMQSHLQGLFADNKILVAHNSAFDVEMLKREGIVVEKQIDTIKVAQFLDTDGIIPKYNMQYLRYYFDLDVSDAIAHNALGDIRVLEKLFEMYFEKMQEVLGGEEKVIEAMLEISSHPILVKRFNFGKYKDRLVKEIAAEDRNYLLWLLNQKIMARENGEDNDADWIYTLDHYVNKGNS